MQTVYRNTETPYPPHQYLNGAALEAHGLIPQPRVGEVAYLLDVDHRVRATLSESLEICGFEVQTFATARQYLEYAKTEAPCCLIVDLHLPEIDGLDLHNRLAQNPPPPVIFLSHLADIPSAVRAMKAGAIEFLLKPVDPDALRDSVRRALDRDKKLKAKRAELAALRRLLGTLTPREREVFPLVARGLLNKQAASLLGISEITLQIHRSQVMKKMGAQSLPDLVRMAVKLGVCR